MSYGAVELKMGQIWTFKLNLTLKVKVNRPQTMGILTNVFLHHWSKFGDHSLNGLCVLARTSSGLTHTRTQTHTRTHTHTHGQTDARNDNTRRSKLASDKNCSDGIAKNGSGVKRNCKRIWIVMEKTLVKWVPIQIQLPRWYPRNGI